MQPDVSKHRGGIMPAQLKKFIIAVLFFTELGFAQLTKIVAW